MLPQEIIRAKRDGHTLTADQIAAYVRGVTDGTVTEGQIAAFSMAVRSPALRSTSAHTAPIGVLAARQYCSASSRPFYEQEQEWVCAWGVLSPRGVPCGGTTTDHTSTCRQQCS
jgi:hypothetical protein